MKITRDQVLVLIFAVGFFVSTFLYFQSLSTIKQMYSESVLHSLETSSASSTYIFSDIEPKNDAEPTTPAPTTKPPVVISPEPKPDMACYTGGCSGQLCGDSSIKDIMTTCEWREEYACYQNREVTKCERQATGKCGWTETAELKSCLVESQGATPELI